MCVRNTLVWNGQYNAKPPPPSLSPPPVCPSQNLQEIYYSTYRLDRSQNVGAYNIIFGSCLKEDKLFKICIFALVACTYIQKRRQGDTGKYIVIFFK